jgi:DNA repair protein RecN (Recombination protein N)
MLVELSIENLGIIENVRVSFDKGFTAFTGETGAGKTMLVEAINLVVGRRADVSVIRDGAEEARVEARFVTNTESGEIETILCRVLHREGRSRAYINDRMATVASLAEIGDELVDIHGQHAHQRLLSLTTQRKSLDQFGNVNTTELQSAREAVTHIDANLAALGGDEKSRVREIDLLQFQCDEIESSKLTNPDEDQQLSQEEDMLTDVVRHQESLQKIVSLLSDDGAVVDLLGEAVSAIAPVTSLPALSERLRSLAAEAKDVSDTVRDAAEGSEHDPARLEEIRLRRQSLRDLMRKYGDSLSDVMAFGAEARERLDELTGYAERVTELERPRPRRCAIWCHAKKRWAMHAGKWRRNSQRLYKGDCASWRCRMQRFKLLSVTSNQIRRANLWCLCLLPTQAAHQRPSRKLRAVVNWPGSCSPFVWC